LGHAVRALRRRSDSGAAESAPQGKNLAELRGRLLEWYDRERRDLPWRRSRDPYAIWVSEIMLQQTRVAVVVERYRAFLERFPTLISLARGIEDEVLALWSGLGYYRRARFLHKAAQFVAERQSGNLPATAAALRALPGIGAYTAAAIASIAHGEAVPVVDGNVERVLCRLEGWDGGTGKAGGALKRRIDARAEVLLDRQRPGDFNQAMMELGAVVCLPRNPRCPACPLSRFCATRGEHKTARRAPMLSREVAHALVLRVRTRERGRQAGCIQEVLLERRAAHQTVMPGLWELPALRDATVPEPELRMTLRHAIMKVNYYVRIRAVAAEDLDRIAAAAEQRRWVPLEEAGELALTGLTRKVLQRSRLIPPRSQSRSGAGDGAEQDTFQ
jgi:A/G-specific adenine glycosylase